jgi:hypothetical protein
MSDKTPTRKTVLARNVQDHLDRAAIVQARLESDTGRLTVADQLAHARIQTELLWALAKTLIPGTDPSSSPTTAK